MTSGAAVLALLLLQQQQGPPPAVAGHVKAALAARQAGRLDEAARELSAAARLAPGIAEIHLNLGLVHHQRKDWKAAVDELQAALSLKKDLKGVRDLLGFDYLMLGVLPEAQTYLEAALAEDPLNADAQLWLGLAMLDQGEYRKAIERLEEARKSKPKDLDLLFYLGRAYERAAVATRQELLLLGPESARAHMASAEYAAFNGHTGKAIAEYRKVAELDPSMPGIQAAIGELHANAGEYAMAEEYYRKELAVAPQNSRVNHRYGLVLLQLGRHKEALAHFEKAVALDATLLDAHLELAKALLADNDLPRAGAKLRLILDSGPPLDLKRAAHYQMGLLERKRGNGAEAARHLRLFEELKKE
jgi:tetratricopeptide (TPR) repeat protein